MMNDLFSVCWLKLACREDMFILAFQAPFIERSPDLWEKLTRLFRILKAEEEEVTIFVNAAMVGGSKNELKNDSIIVKLEQTSQHGRRLEDLVIGQKQDAKNMHRVLE